MMKLTQHNCITCGDLLVEGIDGNWYPSFVEKRAYKCKTCYDIRRKENRIKQKNKEEKNEEKWITKDFTVKGNCISPISRQKLKGLKKLAEEEDFTFNPKQKCGRPTVNNGPCCKEHQHRINGLISKWPMTDVLMQKYWDEGLELIKTYNNITLAELFRYVKGSFMDLHSITIGYRKIHHWYRTTQRELGHPIEVLDNRYSHLVGQTGYLEVWKKFGKGELKTSRERVVEYLTKHPGALASEVNKKTKADYDKIYQYVEEEQLDLGAKRRDELKKKVMDYIDKNPDDPLDIIAHETNVAKGTVVKYCEQNNIHVEGMKEKPSMYKRKITDRWK